MREKIERLEQFVNGMRGSEPTPLAVSEGAQSAADSYAHAQAENQDPLTSLTGRLRLSETGSTQFIGPSHWEAIIEDLADVKGYFDIENSPGSVEDEDVLFTDSNVPSLDINFGLAQSYSKRQLLEALPQKHVMDHLIVAWFNSMDPLRLVVHAPTFQAEYQWFWQRPALVSTGWLALLYAIGSLGAEVSGESRKDPALLARAEDMRRLTVHALVLANYAALPPYAVETLLLHIKCCLLKHIDVTREIYLRLGLLTRLCTLAGYHRDPSKHAEISPFQAEMRRRLWWFVSKYDILMCYQLGQLSVINQLMVDTGPPCNLDESDLTSQVIPPTRPLTEHTSITTAIVYGELTAIFGEVVYSSNSTTQTSRTDVARLHDRLIEAHNNWPPQLRMATLEQSLLEPTDIVIARYTLEILYLKSICILYRRYLGVEGHAEERQRCLDAAEQVIQHQNTLLEAGRPGGLLEQADVWFRRFIHDFIFVAMLLCLELKSSPTDSTSEQQFNSRVRSLLQYSCKLWSRVVVTSPKARHALRALGRFLDQEIPLCVSGRGHVSNGPVGGSSGFDHSSQTSINGLQLGAVGVSGHKRISHADPDGAPKSVDPLSANLTSLPPSSTPGLNEMMLDGTSHEWDLLFQDVFGIGDSTAENSAWP